MNIKALIQRHPVATYFSLVLLISYGSFLVVVGPKLLRGGTEQASDAEYVVVVVAMRYGKRLVRQPMQAQAGETAIK